MKSSLESLRSKISNSGRDADVQSINTRQSTIKSIMSTEEQSNYTSSTKSDNIQSSFHQHAQLLRRGDDDDDEDDDLDQPMDTVSLGDDYSKYPANLAVIEPKEPVLPERDTQTQRSSSLSRNSPLSMPASAVLSNGSSLSLPDEGSSGSTEDDSTLPTLMGKYDQPKGKKTIILMDPALQRVSEDNDEDVENEPEVFEDEHFDKKQPFSGRSHASSSGRTTEHISNQAVSKNFPNGMAPPKSAEPTPSTGHPSFHSSSDWNSLGNSSFRPISPRSQDGESVNNYSNINKQQTHHSIASATASAMDGDGSVRSFYDASFHPKQPEQARGQVEAVPFNRASYPTTRSSQIPDYPTKPPPTGQATNADLSNHSSKKPAKSALRPTRRYGRQAPDGSVDDRTVLSGGEFTSSGSRSSHSASRGPGGGGLPYQYSSSSSLNVDKKKGGARIRALAALICIVVSIILASLYANGSLGLSMSKSWMHMDGKSVMNKGNGLPAPIGHTQGAFNGSAGSFPNLKDMHLILPVAMENYADWTIPFPVDNGTDLPVFWTIPRAGGQVLSSIFGQCLGLVEASGAGAGNQQPALQIYETPKGTRYVNVDTTTITGLLRADRLGLVDSGFADVMYTTIIADAAGFLFNAEHHGRLFAVFRDPIERAMSVFQQAKTLDPTVKLMSMAEYATQRLVNNEMVRTLVQQNATADLSQDDLTMAMEILRRKCVIGLVDRMEESLSRLEMYFGWESRADDASVKSCQKQFLIPSTERLHAPKPGSDAYHVLMNQNRLDIQLYEYARYLYDVQGGN